MKKKIAVILMTILVGGLLYFTGINTGKAYYYGPPAGTTGSPNDGQTCDQSGCHNNFSLQSAKPTWIASNVPLAGYTPGTVYTITAKAVMLGETSFGFEISPQTTGGSPLGTLIVTNSTTTQIATNNSLQYMEQTQLGYIGTDSVVWNFNWRAPISGTGSVTFYGAFNCGSGTDVTSAHIYPSTLIIPENNTAGVADITNEGVSFSVFPNPAHQQVNITYTLQHESTVKINIYGVDGKKVSTLSSGILSEGEHIQNSALPSAMAKGIYFIQLVSNEQATMQKIIVE